MTPKIITDILKVAEALKKSKLKYDKLSKVEDEFERLKIYFKCNRIQIIFITIMYELHGKGQVAYMKNFSAYLDCNPIELMPHQKDIEELLTRELILRLEKRLVYIDTIDCGYKINQAVLKAIVENNPIEIELSEKNSSPMEIILHLCEMIDERENVNGSTTILWQNIEGFLEDHDNIELCRELLKISKEPFDVMTLIFLMARNIEYRNSSWLEDVTEAIIDNGIKRRSFERSFEQNENVLIKHKWVVIAGDSFINMSDLQLTDYTVRHFKSLGVDLKLRKKTKNIQLTPATSVTKKKLYFNTEEQVSIDNLMTSLKVRKHGQIIKALKNEGLRTGICTLYYGAPGTGKTESVYQIARATGRSIWKVDMSELKSMWFGESQKLVRNLFKDYYTLCKEEKRTPILLLNEADAILGKRSVKSTGSSSKAENAIQNIFLDGMEDFEGILFATTNLESSLDKAFERRFLFKLKFERPDALAQIKIWRSKIKGLSLNDAKKLTQQFSLSGGEIENVARKLKIESVINGKGNTFDRLIHFCQTEKLQNDAPLKMGFTK